MAHPYVAQNVNFILQQLNSNPILDWSPPRLYTKCPPVFSMAKSRYNDVSIVRVRVRVWVKDGVSQQGVSDQLTMEQMTHRNNTPHVPGE